MTINTNRIDDLSKAFNIAIKHLEDFKQNSLKPELGGIVISKVNKFIRISNEFIIEPEIDYQDINIEIESFKSAIFSESTSLTRKTIEYGKLIGEIDNIYEAIMTNYERNSNDLFKQFEGAFSFNYKNTNQIVSTLYNAIELINADRTLSPKTKEKLIKKILEIINELSLENIDTLNFSKIVGSLKEIVFVIGAFAGIISGYKDVTELNEAKNKIENATESVIKNITINNVNQNTILLTPQANTHLQLKGQ